MRWILFSLIACLFLAANSYVGAGHKHVTRRVVTKTYDTVVVERPVVEVTREYRTCRRVWFPFEATPRPLELNLYLEEEFNSNTIHQRRGQFSDRKIIIRAW